MTARGNYSDAQERTAVLNLLLGAVPERAHEIRGLWSAYEPGVSVQADQQGVTVNATRHRIAFDAKSLRLFWLVGFAAWKSVECYSPAVVVAGLLGQPVDSVLRSDDGLSELERDFRERAAVARALRDTSRPDEIAWPPDIPKPTDDRESLGDPQDVAAFDLVLLATAFVFLHELHHLILAKAEQRPADLAEEEMRCDVWARTFLTEKVDDYARANNVSHAKVMQKRIAALAIGVAILHAITPDAQVHGTSEYPALKDRFHALVGGAGLPNDSWAWTFLSSILVGIRRLDRRPVPETAETPRSLFQKLLDI